MKLCLITPASRGSRRGNRITALRWRRILRQLGHDVAVLDRYQGGAYEAGIVLHARRGAESLSALRGAKPPIPVILALTGTDLYQDLPRGDEVAWNSVWQAQRLVVLHPAALDELPGEVHEKTRVIVQSAAEVPRVPPHPSRFDVAVVGHLREVKDPFRTAHAVRRLPADSRIHVLHAGEAMDESMRARAEQETRENPRYEWLGEISRSKVRKLLASSQLLVLSSKMEGGANVISEAVMADTPILSTKISGSTGLLGISYPGLFRVGDTEALTALLSRAETDPLFLETLRQRCREVRSLFDPAHEQVHWRQLLSEIRDLDGEPDSPR